MATARAVSRPAERLDDSDSRPGSGTLLAIRDLVATPPHGSRALPPGDDGKPRRLTVANMPDRFHKPGEVSAYEAYEVTEWTDTMPN